ncbi:MAG: hypothetical protein V4607_02105 [Pseudomonadota bacterium]
MKLFAFLASLFRPSPARALAESMNSSQADGLIPSVSSVTLLPEPPAVMVQVFYHAGQRFEKLSESRQEQAQHELYLKLKAKQLADPMYGKYEDSWTEVNIT